MRRYLPLLLFLTLLFIPLRVLHPSPSCWVDRGIVLDPTTKAYYPTVLYDPNNFSGYGPSYPYKIWFSTGTGITLAYSADGVNWILHNSGSDLPGLTNPHHARVIYDPNGFGGTPYHYKIWYWDTSKLYTIEAIRYAESTDGINWVNDQPITQNPSKPLVGPYDWNRGSYGPMWIFYNPNAGNTGSDPWNYKYVMYYDATTGAFEQIALAYSKDGINWTRYGDTPVLWAEGYKHGAPWGDPRWWDSSYVGFGTILFYNRTYHMWYSGGVEHMHEGIGHATSPDGIHWTKDPNNPIFTTVPGTPYEKRHYTPSVIYDPNLFSGYGDSSVLKMWFTAKDASGNYAIGYRFIKASSITLSPHHSTIMAGESVRYTATAYSCYGLLWNITNMVSLHIEPAAGGRWHQTTYYSQYAGQWNVMAEYWTPDGVLLTDNTTLEVISPVCRLTSNVTDLYLIVNGSKVDVPYEMSLKPGETITVEAPREYYPNSRERFIFLKWSNGSTHNTLQITGGKCFSLTALYTHEYQVLVLSKYGSTKGTGWYPEDAEVEISVASLVVETKGCRYVFRGWRGTGLGSYTGSSDTAIVQVEGPITQIATWDIDSYFVNATSPWGEVSGVGWYPPGSIATISINPLEITLPNSTRWFFIRWEGDLESNSSHLTFEVVKPVTLRALWRQEYLLIVSPTRESAIFSEASLTEDRRWLPKGETIVLKTRKVTDLGVARVVFDRWIVENTYYDSPEITLRLDRPLVMYIEAHVEYPVRITVKSPIAIQLPVIIHNQTHLSVSSGESVTYWLREGYTGGVEAVLPQYLGLGDVLYSPGNSFYPIVDLSSEKHIIFQLSICNPARDVFPILLLTAVALYLLIRFTPLKNFNSLILSLIIFTLLLFLLFLLVNWRISLYQIPSSYVFLADNLWIYLDSLTVLVPSLIPFLLKYKERRSPIKF